MNFSALEKIGRGARTAILENEEEVTHTISTVEIGNIEDAIQKIRASRQTIIFVRGFSELITQEIMVKFQLTGKHCELHTDPEIIKNISRKLSKKDVVLFVSLSGETQKLVAAGRNCHDSEIGTILLTVNKHSSLTKYVEIPLVGFKLEDFFFPDYEVCSQLLLSILARILLGAYALRTIT